MDDTTEDVQADSPAAPGNLDATPVSRSSTPPSGSHIPPQTQPEEAGVQASVEPANASVVDSGTVDRRGRSIFALLKECIPRGSESVLESVIHQRPYALASLKSDSGSMRPHMWNPEAVWKEVDKLKPSEHVVLVIHSIDDKWCEALCSRYPKAINRKFLLEHILGLDAEARLPELDRNYEEHEEELKEMLTADLERLDRVFPCLSESTRPAEEFGSHVDCWKEEEEPTFRTCSVRGCRLRLIRSKWVKTNCFLSYCQVRENFYVIFTSLLQSLILGSKHRLSDHTMCVTLSFEGWEHRVAWWLLDKFDFPTRLLRTSWPLFAWKVRARERGILSSQKRVDSFLLVAWFVATTLLLRVEYAEKEMRSLAYLTIDDDQERSKQLIDFRRDVGKCYDDLAQLRLFVDSCLEPYTLLLSILPDSGLDLQQRQDLKEPIRAYLAVLEQKLGAIKEALNEELQVVVGTVQVREAQLMREQARVTARQTTWTVALTVLAAVYLPMTLVTGIFGMNITEISSEATAPNAWWAVGAWAVVVALTVAGILSYVGISKLRARKRKSDLEANDEAEKSNDKGKSKIGKWFGETSKDWIRWLKQKAKIVWTPKQE